MNAPEAPWQNSLSISVVHYRPRADQSYLSPDDLVLNVFKAHQSRADRRPISHPLLALSIMCHCVCVSEFSLRAHINTIFITDK